MHGQGPGKRTCASHIYVMPACCGMQYAECNGQVYHLHIYMSIHTIYIGGQ